MNIDIEFEIPIFMINNQTYRYITKQVAATTATTTKMSKKSKKKKEKKRNWEVGKEDMNLKSVIEASKVLQEPNERLKLLLLNSLTLTDPLFQHRQN